MNLTEVYNRLIIDNFWRNLEVSYMSESAKIPPKLAGLLSSANELVFKKFGISSSDKNYFIAGSGRLHLDSLVKQIFKLKGDVGDLDVVIADKGVWSKAVMMGKLNLEEVYINNCSKCGSGWQTIKSLQESNVDENGIMELINEGNSNLAYRPKEDKSIEVFDKWNPALAGGEYASTKVRSTKEINHDAVNVGGYRFMNIGDVLDYKLKMNRDKEAAIVNLINEFRAARFDDKNVKVFFKKLAEIVGEEEVDNFRKVMSQI